ncbi:MAG: methionyl aminopeptidase [Proteobacteria bacterium]|nr:methionyl aminopeptidase [Pseudomonadota bacterium]
MSGSKNTGKIQRNDPCWCGSGKKYKKCHLAEDKLKRTSAKASPPPRAQKIARSSEYVEGMAATCRLARDILKMVEENIRIGITTNTINDWVEEYTLDHGAVPATLNYKGFPKSTCTSLNEVICHGIPSETELKEGDIINVDITCNLNGYFGDTSQTFLMGECSEDAKKITAVAEECLRRGIAAVQPYGKTGDIGAVIQEYAHSMQCSVVEKFVGHGIGKRFHKDPQVPHFGERGTGATILPGMFFTIEPMINLGKKDVRILEDQWTAVTIDGKLSAQFEHTLYIMETGVRTMTE